MSDEPSGAIDRTFAEKETDPREQIEDELAGKNTELSAGDVAIDLVYHRPVYIRRNAADSCVEYWKDGDFDITTYKAHPYLPVTAEDPVFECVYLPTKPGDITHEAKSNTYDFPSGRLARVPVELLWGGDTPPQENLKRAVVAGLLASCEDSGQEELVAHLAGKAFGESVAADAADRAGAGVEPGVDDG